MEKKYIHLRTKILLLCLLTSLISIFIVYAFSNRVASSVVYRLEMKSSNNTLINIKNELYEHIKSYENNLIKIYNNSSFIKDLTFNDSTNFNQKYSNLAFNFVINNFEPDQKIGALYIYDNSFNLISNYRYANTPRYNYPKDIFNTEYNTNKNIVIEYLNSNNKTILISGYKNENTNKELVRLVIKLFSGSEMSVIGFIVCDLNINSISRIINKHKISENQFFWIQPMNDKPILEYGNLDSKNKKFYNYTSKLISNGEELEFESEIVSNSLFMKIYMDKYNLDIVSLTPQSLLKESQLQLRNHMFIVVIGVLITTIIAVMFFSKSITKPIKEVVDDLEKISSGETGIRLKTKNNDEIGLLAQTVNSNLNQIQKMAEHEYQLEMLIKQAEYRTLQAQVNPHFLYNTLNTMSGIANEYSCSEVSNLSNALSNIFRYSIDLKDPLALFEKELLHLKNYLYIMNKRTTNKVDLDIKVNSEVLNIKIPRLTLQPIVENSINHGFKNKSNNKKIEIFTTVKDEYTEILIKDNGHGMDASDIMKKISLNTDQTLELKKSIGLANINSRLTMFYGKNSCLKIESRLGVGTEISFLVPHRVTERILC